MITIRLAQWPQDVAALSALDTSYITQRIYRPLREEWSFRLIEEDVSPPLRKQHDFRPADPDERRNWDYTAIAEAEGQLAGCAAAQYVAWNRRVVILNLYVAPAYRRLGVGTQLLAALDTFARSVGARWLWAETQNVNYPAIQFYRRSGFRFCGFDDTFYYPESLTDGEVALFFARPVSSP
ncbi:MAG TPA: GNAT family N-acetyltransferase [Chthonomonadaceae bacterium]|nr:GNAT family N-acetyltransferase [Chthonomonadaceae bacterium]